MLQLLLALVAFLTITTNPTYSGDYEDAEQWYFKHRVNLFDVKHTSTEFLCLIAIQDHSPIWEKGSIYQPYVIEARRRGITEKECAYLTMRFGKIND